MSECCESLYFDNMSLLSQVEDLNTQISQLKEENERYRITLQAENDRLDRNTKLEEENKKLKQSSEKLIYSMSCTIVKFREDANKYKKTLEKLRKLTDNSKMEAKMNELIDEALGE